MFVGHDLHVPVQGDAVQLGLGLPGQGHANHLEHVHNLAVGVFLGVPHLVHDHATAELRTVNFALYGYFRNPCIFITGITFKHGLVGSHLTP